MLVLIAPAPQGDCAVIMHRGPLVVALAGPNGAGKSTAGPALLRDTLNVPLVVNADTIARGLSMSNQRADVARIFAEGTLIDEALRRAGRQAVLEHVREGLPIAVWRDGRVVWIPPEELSAEVAKDTD